jgi:hypothetical protein
MTVSLATLKIISWNSGISWRRLTNSFCGLERVTEISDCPSLSFFRLRLRGLCVRAGGGREVDGGGCGGVAGCDNDCFEVRVRFGGGVCEVIVCRGSRYVWVPV